MLGFSTLTILHTEVLRLEKQSPLLQIELCDHASWPQVGEQRSVEGSRQLDNTII